MESKYLYCEKCPKIDDVVVVRVTAISDSGVYVTLEEYSDMPGFILSTEINKYKIKLDKIFKIDKTYSCVVVDIDTIKNTIDLSYKRIEKDDQKKYERKFVFIEKIYKLYSDLANLKLCEYEDEDYLITNTFRQFCNRTTMTEDIDVEKIYFDILDNPTSYFSDLITTEYPSVIEKYLDYMKGKIKNTNADVYRDFDLTVMEPDAPKKLGDICSIEDDKIKIIYTCPKFRIYVNSETEQKADKILDETMELIKSRLSTYKHVFQYSPTEILKKRTIKYVD